MYTVTCLLLLTLELCRVYRGEVPQGVTTSPILVSHGGTTNARSLKGHNMGSIWLRQEDIPAGAAGQ